MMNFEAAAIVLWYQDGNRRQFKDAAETTREFYLDRAHAVIEAAVGDKVLYEPKAGAFLEGKMESVIGNLSVAETGGDIAEVLDALERWVQVYPEVEE